MKMRMMATALALTMVAASASTLLAQGASISGTAVPETKGNPDGFSVRVQGPGAPGSPQALNPDSSFTITGLPGGTYSVQLLKGSKVVCNAGPFGLDATGTKSGIIIDCKKLPTSALLILAGAGAGITAAVTSTQDPATPTQTDASPSR